MRLFNVHIGAAGVVFYHFQGAVAEQRFESEKVASGTQVRDRKRMSKSVRVALPDLGFLSKRAKQLPERIPVHRTVVLSDE
jgi:hypothetical protein